MSAWKEPAKTQLKSVWSKVRSSGALPIIATSMIQPRTADAVTVRTPR